MEGWNDSMWTGVFLGALGVLSTDEWPFAWLILELNLISFIPILTKTWSMKKLIILYFIVQRVGSLAILTSGLVSDRTTRFSQWALLGLLLKARLAPFHFWGGEMVVSINRGLTCLFLTWQKIAPLAILLRYSNLAIMVFLNLLVAARCSVASKKLRLVIFFSGLINICWVLVAPRTLAYKYFILYCLISAPIFFLDTNPFLILNIAGLPPMSGFFIKLRVLQTTNVDMGIVLLTFSVPLLYAYMRVFVLSPSKWKFNITTLFICSVGAIVF